LSSALNRLNASEKMLLQCVLQCIALCCRVLQCNFVQCVEPPQRFGEDVVAVCVAVYCIVLQSVAV